MARRHPAVALASVESVSKARAPCEKSRLSGNLDAPTRRRLALRETQDTPRRASLRGRMLDLCSSSPANAAANPR